MSVTASVLRFSAPLPKQGELAFTQEQALHNVIDYHEKTKHQLLAYAKGPETLDWDNQPNPFRYFYAPDDPRLIALTLQDIDASHTYSAVEHGETESVTAVLNYEHLSQFLRYAMGLSAWKQHGPDRWSMRVNPSSGNLHPTETYIVLPQPVGHLEPALYHYNVEQHGLEQRTTGFMGDNIEQGFYLVFTSVVWREAWKYGERSFRYCQLDTGHAIGAVLAAAKLFSWTATLLTKADSEKIYPLLGLQRPDYNGVEGELAECVLYINAAGSDTTPTDINRLSIDDTALSWFGQPSRLGQRSFYQWPCLSEVALATDVMADGAQEKPVKLLPATRAARALNKTLWNDGVKPSYSSVILHRRSAQAYTKDALVTEDFFACINALQHELTLSLFGDQQPLQPVIIVHQVDGIAPGVYLLPSAETESGFLRDQLTAFSAWDLITVAVGSNEYALISLRQGSFQKLAGALCCQQAIAKDCGFLVGFMAKFDAALHNVGPNAYRKLHWQAGMLSQKLYLQATAVGAAATGIGCFFDDVWHEFLGISGRELQLLYFTAVGYPLLDERITSFSPFYHLRPQRAQLAGPSNT